MAVKYLSGNRLWGTNAERLAMTTGGNDSWTEMDDTYISINTATNRIDFDMVHGSIDNIYKDVGTVSDNTWALRFIVNFSTALDVAGDQYFRVALGRIGTTGGNNNPPNGINIFLQHHSLGNIKWGIYGLGSTDTSDDGVTSKDTDYYVTFKRTGELTTTLDIKTISHSGTSLTSFPLSTDATSTASSMDTLYFANRETAGSYSLAGTVRDIQLWKTTSSTLGSPDYEPDWSLVNPNLPNGTIFNETDTYKYFMWNGTDTWNQMVSS